MYIENNPLRFVYIGNFRGDIIDEMKLKRIQGAYYGEYYILTTSDSSQEQVYDMIRELLDGDENWIEEIKLHSINNIEDYVCTCYQEEEYEIFGVSGMMCDQCENVMETLVYAFNDGKLSEEDLSDWEGLIDKTIKQHIMENVIQELEDKVKKLSEQGYNIKMFKELFE